MRIVDPAVSKTKSYYYTVAENGDFKAQTKVSFKNGLSRTDNLSLLAAGRTLKARFVSLR